MPPVLFRCPPGCVPRMPSFIHHSDSRTHVTARAAKALRCREWPRNHIRRSRSKNRLHPLRVRLLYRLATQQVAAVSVVMSEVNSLSSPCNQPLKSRTTPVLFVAAANVACRRTHGASCAIASPRAPTAPMCSLQATVLPLYLHSAQYQLARNLHSAGSASIAVGRVGPVLRRARIITIDGRQIGTRNPCRLYLAGAPDGFAKMSYKVDGVMGNVPVWDGIVVLDLTANVEFRFIR